MELKYQVLCPYSFKTTLMDVPTWYVQEKSYKSYVYANRMTYSIYLLPKWFQVDVLQLRNNHSKIFAQQIHKKYWLAVGSCVLKTRQSAELVHRYLSCM